jgi:adenylate cyclase
MLASADVVAGLGGLVTRELGAFLLAGKSRPVLVHELVVRAADATPADRERCALFARALAAFRRGAWAEATRLWQHLARMGGADDGPSRFYLRWCEAHAGELPSEDWDGVVRMEQK